MGSPMIKPIMRGQSSTSTALAAALHSAQKLTVSLLILLLILVTKTSFKAVKRLRQFTLAAPPKLEGRQHSEGFGVAFLQMGIDIFPSHYFLTL